MPANPDVENAYKKLDVRPGMLTDFPDSEPLFQQEEVPEYPLASNDISTTQIYL